MVKRGKLERVLADMQSEDPRVAKGGIQAACELLEANASSGRTVGRIGRALSVQLVSTDTQVRRWMYKLIALMQNPMYLGFLERQLAEVDMVPENRTWLVAAMSGVDPMYAKRLYDAGEEMTVPYALAAGMYRDTGAMEATARAATNGDDPLAHQWLGLTYGEGRVDLDRMLISELTSSPSPEVVEYIIWGIRLRREFGVESINIDPTSLKQQAVNIRRWYYRTVAQDPTARNAFAAQVIAWIEAEADSKAREGLARGLHESPKDRFWRDVERMWCREERDPFVLRALGVPVSTMNMSVATAQFSGVRLDVDRPILMQDLPAYVSPSLPFSPTNPIERHTIVMNINNSVTVNNSGNIGQVMGANGLAIGPVTTTAKMTSNSTKGTSAAELTALLTALSQHLRSLSAGSVPTAVITEVDDLAVEHGIIAAASNTNTTGASTGEKTVETTERRRRFGQRLASVVTTLRGLGAATQATSDLVDQVEHLAHILS